MTDEKKNISPDDEYQFPQDEYAASGAAKPELESLEYDHVVKKSFGANFLEGLRQSPLLKNKRFVIVVVVLIVIIVGARLFHHAPAPITQPVAQISEPAPNDNGMLDSFKSRTESQIRDLRSQLSDLQDSVNQTQSDNQQLQTSVADLTSQVQLMSEELSKLMAKAPAKITAHKIIFHLRAIIPDRAWITSNTGQSISVTIGDHVKEYGTVQSIDAQHGIVTTSSGRKIEYGPNDF